MRKEKRKRKKRVLMNKLKSKGDLEEIILEREGGKKKEREGGKRDGNGKEDRWKEMEDKREEIIDSEGEIDDKIMGRIG